MGVSVDSRLGRREFLALGVGACCALGLAACGQTDSKGSYDDGYAAGYAAGVADAETKAAQEEEEKAASTPTSGIEYTITGASLAAEKYSDKTLLVLELTGKNVSDSDQMITFSSTNLSVYQDGKGLTSGGIPADGREIAEMRTVQPETTLDGWAWFELIDTTTPVEIKAMQLNGADYYGLTNPQTIDPTTL